MVRNQHQILPEVSKILAAVHGNADARESAGE